MSVPAAQPGLALVDDGDVRARRIDHEALERAVGDILRALGADTAPEGLRDTPRRVAEAYVELLTPPAFRVTTFPNEDGYEGLIVAQVQQPGARTVTSALRGAIRDDPQTRQEFLALTTRTSHDR